MQPYETKNGSEYVSWLVRNPGGFVVNVAATLSPSYFVIHRSTCRTIRPDANGQHLDPEAFTQRSYRKFVAETEDELRDWGVAEGFTRIRNCGHCMRMMK